MYLPAGNRVVALEPETGKEIWRYELKRSSPPSGALAYWPGDRNSPPRILFYRRPQDDALNANTGKLDPGFGREGEMIMDVRSPECPRSTRTRSWSA